jgi:hypothetical protein
LARADRSDVCNEMYQTDPDLNAYTKCHTAITPYFLESGPAFPCLLSEASLSSIPSHLSTLSIDITNHPSSTIHYLPSIGQANNTLLNHPPSPDPTLPPIISPPSRQKPISNTLKPPLVPRWLPLTSSVPRTREPTSPPLAAIRALAILSACTTRSARRLARGRLASSLKASHSPTGLTVGTNLLNSQTVAIKFVSPGGGTLLTAGTAQVGCPSTAR